MAKKKAKPLERDQRPEFLAALALLPEGVEALHAWAARLRLVYNDAIVAGDDDAREQAALEHDAVVYRLNGDTFFGCRGDDTRPGKVLDALHTARPGQVPHWGQDGEFLIEVDGMRVLVNYGCEGLRTAPGFDATAVDLEKPYFSETGFRNVYMSVADHAGRTLEQAVRAEIAEQMATDGLKAIKRDAIQWIEKRPKWLADVLAGVTRDGQLAMFGDEPPKKVPMTNAQRQQKRRKLVAKLKAEEGLKAVMLNAADRALLGDALDLLNEHQNPKGDRAAYQLALLRKLKPGADWRPEQARTLAGMRWNFDARVSHAQSEQRRAERDARSWQARAEAAEKVLIGLGSVQVDGHWQGVEQLPQEMADMLAEHGPVVVCLHAIRSWSEVIRVANSDASRAAERAREVIELRRQLDAARAGGFVLPDDAN